MPDRMLEGQVALVTGAGRGLGRAFAERLAALGCHIAVHGMREEGPSEYGGRETLTDVARSIAETHGVRTAKILADLTRMRRRRAHRGRCHGRARPHRHPRPQRRRRHRRGRRQARPQRRGPHQGRGRARGDRPQPAEHDLRLPGRRARHDGAAHGPHDHHHLGRRPQGAHQRIDLRDGQGRRHALHALPRRPDAALQCHRQRHRPRRHAHRALPGHAQRGARQAGGGGNARPHRHGRRGGESRSSSSPAPSAPSCRARSCASTARARPGLPSARPQKVFLGSTARAAPQADCETWDVAHLFFPSSSQQSVTRL